MSELLPGPVVPLRLKSGKRHRVLHGHPWVFSNQLVEIPADLQPGSGIEVRTHGGAFVGRGYGHPGTLITARLLTRVEGQPLDSDWLAHRLDAALAARTGLQRSAYRWLHGEADGVPGLIIDRYGDGIVASANTAGTESMRPAVEQILKSRFGVARGIWKGDTRGRKLEGLPASVESGWGDTEGDWTIDDDGLAIRFDPWGGQKTGLFLDMWENRRRMVPLLGSGRVVDLFSYVGQWGLHIAAAGATEVTCIDRSEGAIAQSNANAAANGLNVAGRVSSVDKALGAIPDGSLDAIVCDPPAFIQNKKQVAGGARAYRKLFAQSLRKLRPGGRAVLASCSHHLWEDRFAQVVSEAAQQAGTSIRVLMRGGQAPCHPVPLNVPESRYLKCWLVQTAQP